MLKKQKHFVLFSRILKLELKKPNRMKKVLLVFSLFFSTLYISAQGPAHSCGFDHLHQEYLKQHPEYAEALKVNEQQIQEIIARRKKSKTQENLYTIPVVVHVIHTGEAVGVGHNISDAQINSGITQLNNAFRNTHGQSLDINIQFQLATKDPNCNATTGINRIDGSVVTDYATMGVERSTSNGAPVADIRALSRWSRDSYYNFWIISEIDNNDGGSGIQGFAQFPNGSADSDGTVILNSAWGNVGTAKSYTDEGKTIIHEVGHGFGLYHTFEGDGGGSSCPTGNQCGSGLGDCCGDTPPHQRSASNCNTGGTNSCDGGSSNGLFVHNYMDYSSETCQYLFSSEQKARMRAALESSRSSLLLSKGLSATAPTFSIAAASCTPTTSATGLGGGFAGIMNVQIEGKLNVSTSNTQNDGGYLNNATSCQSAAVLDLNSTYEFKTTVWVNTHYVKAWIDYNNNGSFEAGELIYDKTMPASSTDSANFTVPGSATTGSYLRMRVLGDLSTSFTDPCHNPTYGQAEDYVVYINSAAAAAPVAAFSASKTTVCVGETVTFNDASTNTPTSWAWTTTGGNPSSSTNQNQAVVYNTAGTYSVSLTATNAGGSDPEVKNSYITVVAPPTVALGADTAICAGASKTLDAGNSGSTYVWSTGATTQTISASSAGTYHVAVTNPTGCIGRDTIVITENALPTVSVNSASICAGAAAATFTATAPTATAYLWSANGSGTASTTSGTTAGNYTVQVTDANSCTNTATGVLTVNALPVVTVNNAAICSGDPAATFTATVDSSVTVYNWGGQGTGSTSTTTGTTAGLYISFIIDNNGCTARDTGTLTVNSPPTVSVNNETVCLGDPASTFTATSATATGFVWSGNGSGTANTSSGTAAGNYIVEVTDINGCTAKDTGALTVNALPVVSLGNDTTICGSISQTLDAGNTGSSYSWSTGATTQTINVTSIGTYHVAVTNGNGCIGRDTITIGNNNPTVHLGNDTTFCGSGSKQLDAGAGFTSYLWSTGATTQTITASSAGSYNVVVTDGSGCTDRDTITIAVNNPTVNLANDTTFCGTGSLTLDAGAGFASYLWSNGATTQTLATSGAGDFSVVVTDLNGCTDNDTSTITINNPVVDLGSDTTYCGTGSDTLDAGNFNAYLWNTGATTSEIVITTGGTYSVTVTDADGCSDVDSVTINVSDPQVHLANDTTFCGTGSLTLDAGAGFASYLWSNGATTQTLATSGAGDFSVVVTDLNGCTDNDTTTITINNPVVDLGSDTTYCGTGSDTLDAGNFNAYLWNTGATTSEIVITTGGTYSVTVTDTDGCSDVDSVTINVSDPQVHLANDTTLCGTGSLTLDAGAGFASYLWSNGATTQTLATSGAGDFSVVVTDLNGCTDNDTTTISINNPVVDLGSDTTYCGTGSDTLDAGNFNAYLWNTGATTSEIVITTGGTYSVTVTDADGCSDVDSVTINVSDPVVNLMDDTTFCGATGTHLLDAGNGFTAYLWSTGATSQTIIASGAGDFSVTVTDANGCQDMDTTTIIYSNPVVDLGADKAICQGTSTVLNAGISGATYSWNNGASSQLISVNSAGTYIVNVTTGGGCMDSDSIIVTVNAIPSITIDGSFTKDYVENQGAVNLTFGQPIGGVYSGTGVSGSTFNTSSAGVGSHTITYTYTDGSTGCSNYDTLVINVSPTTNTLNVNNESQIIVRPNPFDTQLSIQLKSSGTSTYQLVDAGGKIALSGSIQGANGVATTTINTDELTPGMYYLLINNENEVSVVKVIKGK